MLEPKLADVVPPNEATDWFSSYGIRHIALIPDGHRRWARQHSLSTAQGHATGLLHVLPPLVERLFRSGVHTFTVWILSTENWARDTDELDHLMHITAGFLLRDVMDLAQRLDVRVCHLGRKDRISWELRKALEQVEDATSKHGSHVYNIAIDYGGKDELNRAAERMAMALCQGRSSSEVSISDFLDTAGQPHPHPDMLIRSSGEQRMSGFLPLQTLYSELFFEAKPFPEFTFELLHSIAQQFTGRNRRFGG